MTRCTTKTAQAAGLYAEALKEEQVRHDRRVRELGRMRHMLGMLDALMPAIKAAGVDVHPDGLPGVLPDVVAGEIQLGQGGTLRLQDPYTDPAWGVRMERVLRAQGLTERGRWTLCGGREYLIELEQGSGEDALRLSFHVYLGGEACA